MNKPASNDRLERPFLVVGIGNPIRGDDGVGPAAARAIEAWRLPHVRVLVVHQLTPDLAHDLAHAQRALLIDADAAASRVAPATLTPSETRAPLGHHTVPSGLLYLTRLAYGHAPPTTLLRIPAMEFDAPDALSPIAAAGLQEALEYARTFLTPRPSIA